MNSFAAAAPVPSAISTFLAATDLERIAVLLWKAWGICAGLQILLWKCGEPELLEGLGTFLFALSVVLGTLAARLQSEIPVAAAIPS